MKPTKTDLMYFVSRKLPAWAYSATRKLTLPMRVSIDDVINAHAEPNKLPHRRELELSNLLALLHSYRKHEGRCYPKGICLLKLTEFAETLTSPQNLWSCRILRRLLKQTNRKK